MSKWVELFPAVDFTDKICVEFKNGDSLEIKHLYYDDDELHKIDWSNVKACFDI